MSSLEWSKQYPILTISRLELVHQLGFSTEQIASLTDEDIDRLTERLQVLYFRNIFDEYVRFITDTILAEMGFHRCCVCGKPAESETVCECVCPICEQPCFDDVTLADHGCCYDCHKKQMFGETSEKEGQDE